MKRLVRAGFAGAVAVAALLAACTSSGSTATPTATATRTVTASPPPAPTSAAPSPTASASVSGDAGGALARCTTDELSGQVGERDGAQPGTGNDMNQRHVAVILSNTGSAPCTLQGWPGVSLVGKGDGTQLGAAAQFNRATPHATVTIAPGAHVQAPLDYTDAEAYPTAECGVAPADGLRVYPPGSTTALFIRGSWSACTSTAHDLLTVGAFVAYP